MTQPPEQVTTPPKGYEWAGEVRKAEDGEYYALWQFDKWGCYSGPSSFKRPILRKLPARYEVTVTLDEALFKEFDEPVLSISSDTYKAIHEAIKAGRYREVTE